MGACSCVCFCGHPAGSHTFFLHSCTPRSLQLAHAFCREKTTLAFTLPSLAALTGVFLDSVSNSSIPIASSCVAPGCNRGLALLSSLRAVGLVGWGTVFSLPSDRSGKRSIANTSDARACVNTHTPNYSGTTGTYT